MTLRLSCDNPGLAAMCPRVVDRRQHTSRGSGARTFITGSTDRLSDLAAGAAGIVIGGPSSAPPR